MILKYLYIMKKIILLSLLVFSVIKLSNAAAFLHNEYAYLQEITFELYTDEVPAYKIPEQLKSIEEILMFEVLHATWKDKHWVAYTLNKNLLGTFKVGQPALMDNGKNKKIFFIASFPGTVGGLDIYTSEYENGKWSNPKNLGKEINTTKNESNPGLLNENTLTYSSGGIIKKLNLKTFAVVDLEEPKAAEIVKPEIKSTPTNTGATKNNKDEIAAIGDNSTAMPAGSTVPKDSDYGAIGDNSTAAPVMSKESKNAIEKQTKAIEEKIVVEEKAKKEVTMQSAPKSTMATSSVVNTSTTMSSGISSLGVQSRDAMLAKYKTAIQLGAFSAPKWEQFEPLQKLGKIITYKNEKGANVVWLVGFANRAAAEQILPQVKAVPGFEDAYVTGK